MSKLYIPLAVSALAMLASCAANDPVTPAPAPVVVAPAPVATAPQPAVVVPQSSVPVVIGQAALRPGFGRVESVTALPQSAAAGGSAMRRFGIKMDDGTMQTVDSTASGINMGERVELTSDGRIRH